MYRVKQEFIDAKCQVWTTRNKRVNYDVKTSPASRLVAISDKMQSLITEHLVSDKHCIPNAIGFHISAIERIDELIFTDVGSSLSTYNSLMEKRELFSLRLRKNTKLNSRILKDPGMNEILSELYHWNESLNNYADRFKKDNIEEEEDKETDNRHDYGYEDADEDIDLRTPLGRCRLFMLATSHQKSPPKTVAITSAEGHVYAFKWKHKSRKLVGPCIKLRFNDTSLEIDSIGFDVDDIKTCPSYSGSGFAKKTIRFANHIAKILNLADLELVDASFIPATQEDHKRILMTPYLWIMRGYGLYDGYGFLDDNDHGHHPHNKNQKLQMIHDLRSSEDYKMHFMMSIVGDNYIARSKQRTNLVETLADENDDLVGVVQHINRLFKTAKKKEQRALNWILHEITSSFHETVGDHNVMHRPISKDGEMVIINPPDETDEAPFLMWLF
jgi:hypothetical protein